MRLSKTAPTSKANINNTFISDFINKFSLFLALFASVIMWRTLATPTCGFKVWEDCSFPGLLQRCVFSWNITQVYTDSDTRWCNDGVFLFFPQTVCSSSSLSASQMETTMKLLKRRLQSRLALHRQFASLGTFLAPPTDRISHEIFGFNRSYVIRAQHHPSLQ